VGARVEHIVTAGGEGATRASALEDHVSAAFESLREPVYWYVFYIVGNAAEAEDISQEAFLRLFRDLHNGQDIANVRAWIFRVAHNLALSVGRERAAITCGDGEAIQALPDRRPDPEQSAIASETERGIRRALRRLSAQERQCLLLRSEGLRYREIAQILGIRVSTVATFVSRAVSKISEAVHA
jgi:RNA polymerase sigma-70 factor (ECF subfamily)